MTFHRRTGCTFPYSWIEREPRKFIMHNFISWGRPLTIAALTTFVGLSSVGSCTTASPEVCGDDELNADDECDGDDFGDATCATAGFDEGALKCSSSCKIETTACVLLDEDQDELNIYDEEYWGTDPLNPDTDGDGIIDGVEYHNGADPLLIGSWPGHIGIWPNRSEAAAAAGVTSTGTGLQVGDVMANEAWVDQNGQPVNLHQFYGYVTVVTVAARWCPPCQLAAETSQALLTQHLPQGVIFIEQLVNGLNPNTNAVQSDADIWANQYALQYPVVFGADPISTPSIPTYFILDRELRIRRIFEGYPGDPALSGAINNAVATADGD